MSFCGSNGYYNDVKTQNSNHLKYKKKIIPLLTTTCNFRPPISGQFSIFLNTLYKEPAFLETT